MQSKKGSEKQTKQDVVRHWAQSNPKQEGVASVDYYKLFLTDNPDIEISYLYFTKLLYEHRGSGRYGQGEQAGISKAVRAWIAQNDRQEGEVIVAYHKRCAVECTLDTFQYALRYTPNDEHAYKEKRITELPKRGTYFKEGQKVVIYHDYVKRDAVEGEAVLTDFIERGQPLIINGSFVCVEIWNVRFSDGFETRRRILCV